ncbi:hypothetical protein PYCCODRAFT_542319 [Trametes coccinea BRFM310]|uniref:Uncharacterized protein n=1 Tax=Trametes coccinea (strain BRFM310) TaxID=1353009 RepID=A0A1Y2IJQ0_TRAC3|nr:hypothetical protein PYCCODRAFT_542319 [Trametes coccinea BRFM310]
MANKRARPAADVIANSDVKAPREADSQPYRHRPLGDSRLPPPLQPPPAYGLHAQEQSGVQSATHPQREWPGHQGRVHQPVPQAVLPTSLPPNQPLHHSHSHSRQQPIIHPTTGYQQMPPVQWLQLPLAHGPQPPSMQWLQLPSVQGPQPPSVQWSHPAGPLPPQQRSQTGFQESYSQFNQRPPHTMPPVPGPPSQLPPPAQRQQPVIQASRSRSGVAQGSLQQAMPQIPPSRPVPAKPAKPAKPAPPHPNQPPTQSSQHQQSHHMPTPSQQQPLPESVGTAPRREMNREEPPQPSNPLLQGSEEAPPPQPTSTSTRVIDGLTVRAWKDVDRRDRTANVGRPDHSMLANPPVVLYEPGSVAIDDHVVHHKVTYMDRSIILLSYLKRS